MLNIDELLKMKSLKMSEVIRYSGLHSTKPEDLSAHTIEVQLLTLKIYNELVAQHGLGELMSSVELLEFKLDLLERALLHDLDEVITGDFPRPLKYYNDAIHESIELVARKSVSKLATDELGDSTLLATWLCSKDGLAGAIIKFVDLVVVIRKACLEVLMYHNYEFLKVMSESLGYMKELRLYYHGCSYRHNANDKLVMTYLYQSTCLIIKELSKIINDLKKDPMIVRLWKASEYVGYLEQDQGSGKGSDE